MSDSPNTCELCGKPASVHLSQDGPDGRTLFRHFCGECADRGPLADTDEFDAAPRRRRTLADLAILLGAVFAILALGADAMHLGDRGGFGWRQDFGLAIGAALVLFGAIFRVDLLAVGGMALFFLASAADWLSLGEGHSISLRQKAALAAASLLVLGGLIVRHRRRAAHL